MKIKEINNLISLFILMVLMILLVTQVAAAGEDITFSLNQSEYYFMIGEQAIIPFEIENTYDKDITGALIYTLTQEITQQGFQHFSSNTNSNLFSVYKGTSVVNIGFGTSEDPAVLKVIMSFNYEEKEEMVVDLDEIIIYFVQDESQKQNKENKMQSSSEEAQQQQNQQENQQQEPQAQEQTQQSMTQQKANSMQQNMQQDMNSLKNQMEQEMQEKEQMKQEFGKNVENQEQFKEAKEQLEKEGYKPESKELNPTGNESGDFKYNYNKENGETASISGSMDEGEINEMIKETSEEIKEMKQALENDTKFKEMKEELEKNGFNMDEPEISKMTTNEAQANVPFMNPATNQTANITADFVNTTKEPTNIQLHEDNGNRMWGLLGFFILVLIAILGILAYNKFLKKDKKIVQLNEKAQKKEMIDFCKNAKIILEQAKELFEKGRRKEAYTRVSKALRYFYKHKLNAGKEMTRDMVIRELKVQKKGYKNAAECLDLCDLVKFAKYEANEKDFRKIVNLAEGMIK